MNSSIWVIYVVLFIVLINQNNLKNKQIKMLIERKKRKDSINMNELVKEYLGKDCVIYLWSSSTITGVIEEIKDNWIKVKTNNGKENEIVCTDYISRIKEYPLNKNGKKKMFV